MSKIKPSLPKGMRDFPPQVMAKRNYITAIIREVFEKYGFLQIETPSMENMSTLTGKYGEEGDKLLFKVLNSGDYLNKANAEALEHKDSRKLTPSISEKGLHYDLTVPLARFVVMNQNDITFPFKRYQIQPVWRADRPQKGRYREFYQCDVDVLGSDSLISEVELINIIDEVFTKLNIGERSIKYNNRKILAGIASVAGIEKRFTEFTIVVDKLDKIGKDGVFKEMLARGIEQKSIDIIDDLMFQSGFNQLKEKLSTSAIGSKGIDEVEVIQSYLGNDNPHVKLDISLARGLDYYTGTIIEVVSEKVQIGALVGGGRYDDLTGLFGLPNVSGVGISFGLDRIYDTLEELKLFPEDVSISTQVLFVNFDKETEHYVYQQLQKVRNANIRSEMYPSPVKLQKQMKYANSKNIPYVILIGSEEMKTGQLTLKNMETGEQMTLDIDGVLGVLGG